ncbi:polysaccharide biosynthesis protein [Seohaeicola saemankumensis]|uniref:Polysaccharide biosynthesis protein n=1 Tax=Seohaeicola saemankumensis TaxID=481181 RepID=A0ABW3TDU9_9RHOB
MTRQQKRLILLFLDTTGAGLGFLLAVLLVNGGLPQPGGLAGLVPHLVAVTVLTCCMTVYLGLDRVKLNAYQLPSLVNSSSIGMALGAAAMLVDQLTGSMLPFGVFPVLSMVFLIVTLGSRLIMKAILLQIYKQQTSRKRVLIYGAGQTGQQLAAALATDIEVQTVAFIDDNPTLQSLMIGGLMVHSPADIPHLVRSKAIDTIVLAMPSVSHSILRHIADRLKGSGCEVHVLPSFADLVRPGALARQVPALRLSDLLGRSRMEDELPGVRDTYTGRNILITGAGGSIGSEICRQLLSAKPASLILLDHSELSLYRITRELTEISGAIRIVPILGSVCEASLVRHTIATHQINVILHAAAYKHVPLVEINGIEGLRNNVLGTKVLADAARAAHVERFTLISTDKAVRPVGLMGCSKRLAELIVQDLATRSVTTRFSIVRFGNVMGSSGSVIPLFQEQIARGGPVTLTHDDVTRYFMTLSEAVRLVLGAGAFSRGGDVFVLDMGAPVPIRKVARQMIEASGHTVRDADNPEGDIEIVVTGLRPGEKLHEELLIGSDMLTTPHPKILRAQESHLSQIEMASLLQGLRIGIETRDMDSTTALLRRWVERAASGNDMAPPEEAADPSRIA